MQLEKLQNCEPPYTISYDTRESEVFLNSPNNERSGEHIDFYHIYNAYECIRAWFNNHGGKRQYAANKFYGYLFESVRVIWYEAPAATDSVSLFTRLNVGRIPLTDAELVKAFLLSKCDGGRSDRIHEIAANWDSIERDLRNPNVWSFVSNEQPEKYPARITLLLDTLAGGPMGDKRPNFYTFETLRTQIEESSPDEIWKRIINLHALIIGWYEDMDLYHKIGCLVAFGLNFGDIVKLSEGVAKSKFEENINDAIRDQLDVREDSLETLNFNDNWGKCMRLLVLMNVETMRKIPSGGRYPFKGHQKGAEKWSLEHIHAQHAESLSKKEQWQEWLRLHRESLATLPIVDVTKKEARAALVAEIDAKIQSVDRLSFTDLAKKITPYFSEETPEANAADWMHSLGNLALLSCRDNSALGNFVFEVKRTQILQKDRNGDYIPICTRRVFLKYYTDSAAQQIHFWSRHDREKYFDALTETVKNYLKT